MSKSEASSSHLESDAKLLESAEFLVWSLLDDNVNETQIAELERMLAQSKAVRQRYLDCVHLHIELLEHFAPDALADENNARIPGLGNLLSEGFPGSWLTLRP